MSEQTTLPSWPDILPNMFRDPRFKQLDRYRLKANIDGVRVGVVVASRSRKFLNHALGKEYLDRLREAKRAGTIDAAFVVTARVRKDYTYIYVGHRDAEELYEMSKDVPPRKSEFGEYWLLKPDVTPLGVAASDDDYDDDDDFDF
jgi:hypothetical protein